MLLSSVPSVEAEENSMLEVSFSGSELATPSWKRMVFTVDSD